MNINKISTNYIYQKKYYNKNKEKIAEYKKKWDEAHKERNAKYQKEYYEKNKEKIREYKRKYNQDYFKKNKEKILAYQRERNARKKLEKIEKEKGI